MAEIQQIAADAMIHALVDVEVDLDVIRSIANELGLSEDAYAACADDSGGDEDIAIDAIAAAKSECEDWVRRVEWGADGASVEAWYQPYIEIAGVEVWRGERESVTVDIEPDHKALTRAAGGDTDCDHDWTSEGEGGLRENPGVWSVGGTAMVFHTHCRRCGLRRIERTTGAQRNPGEHDTVEYEQPASWCPDCEREECNCGRE